MEASNFSNSEKMSLKAKNNHFETITLNKPTSAFIGAS